MKTMLLGDVIQCGCFSHDVFPFIMDTGSPKQIIIVERREFWLPTRWQLLKLLGARHTSICAIYLGWAGWIGSLLHLLGVGPHKENLIIITACFRAPMFNTLQGVDCVHSFPYAFTYGYFCCAHLRITCLNEVRK